MTIIAGGELKIDPTNQPPMVTYGVFRLLFEQMGGILTAAAIIIQRDFPYLFGPICERAYRDDTGHNSYSSYLYL